MINVGALLVTLRLSDQMSPALARASKQLSVTGQKLKSMGTSIASTGKSLSMGLTVPLVAMGAAAGIAFGGFEKNMNRVKALTGETGKAFTDMTALAKELGKTTQFSASEAADAMGFLAMAGFKAEDIMSTLPGVLQLAASAQLDLASAADITTNILTGYGRTVEQVSETNDILVKAFTSANTDLVQLGQAFKFVGPVAKGAGIAFEEATAMLALMGNAGIQASMAGTGLRGAIVRLLNPTNKITKALARNGIITKDATGQLLPMSDVVQQLGERSVDAADMMTIFGMRAGPAMVGLVGQGHEAIRKLTGSLEEAGGIAARVANIQMEGLNGAFIRFKSAAEGMMIEVGEQLAPMFIDIFEKGIKFSNWISNTLMPAFTSLSPLTQKIIIGLIAFTAALGPLLIILGHVAMGVGALMTVLGAISLPVAAIVAGIGLLIGVLFAFRKEIGTVISGGINLFLGALDSLKVKLGKMTEEEAAAAKAARELKEEFEEVETTTEELQNALGEAAFTGTVQELREAMHALGAEGLKDKEAMATLMDGIKRLDAEGVEPLTADLQYLLDEFRATEKAATEQANAIETDRLQMEAASAATNEWAEEVEALRKELSGEGLIKELQLLTAGYEALTPGLQNNAEVMIDVGEQMSDLADEGVKLNTSQLLLAVAWKKHSDALKETNDTAKRATSLQDLINRATNADVPARVHLLQDAWEGLDHTQEINIRTMKFFRDAMKRLVDQGGEFTDTLGEVDFVTVDLTESQEALAQSTETIIKRFSKTELQGKVIALENAISALRSVDDVTAESMKALAKEALALRDAGAVLSAEMNTLADSVEDVDAKLLESSSTWAGSLKQGFSDVLEGLPGTVIGAFKGGGGIGGALKAIGAQAGSVLGGSLGSTLGSKLGEMGSKMGGMAGKLLGGLAGMAGPIGAAIGALAGPLIGAIGKLFSGPTVAESVRETSKKMFTKGISVGLSEAIQETRESVGSDFAAMMMHMSSIIDEQGGVMAMGIEKAVRRVRDIFSAVEQGSLSTAQAATTFGESFTKIADALVESGEIASAKFTELITLAEKFGTTAETLKFVGEQSKLVAQGVAAIAASGVKTKAELEDLGLVAVASFESALAAGMSFTDAVKAHGPAIDAVIEAQKSLGITTDNVALRQLAQFTERVKNNEALVAGVEALDGTMLALSRTGALNAETLGAMERQGLRMYEKLIAAGFDQNEAIIMMGPSLKTMMEAHEKLGIPIDENTQRLIDQAKESGTLEEKQKTGWGAVESAVMKVVESLDRFLERLGGIDRGLRDLPREIHTRVRVTEEIERGSGGGGYAQENFQHGTGGKFVDFGSGTPAILHGKERVQTLAEGQREAAGLGGLEKRLESIETLLRNQPRAMGLAISDSLTLIN